MPRPLTETERQEFLADKHIGVLAVAAADGRPPAAIPIWYGYTPGGNIKIETGYETRKARLIRATGVVALTVQHEQPPYRYVTVEGTVVDTLTPAPRQERDAIAIRYLGPEQGRAFVESMPEEGTVLFTIRPDRWITQDFAE